MLAALAIGMGLMGMASSVYSAYKQRKAQQKAVREQQKLLEEQQRQEQEERRDDRGACGAHRDEFAVLSYVTGESLQQEDFRPG